MVERRILKPLVVVESPYRGDVDRNIKYLKRAVSDCLERDEAPFASHLFYTQVLDDDSPEERYKGIFCGYSVAQYARKMCLYVDYGISEGMAEAIEFAQDKGIKIEVRRIGKNPAAQRVCT